MSDVWYDVTIRLKTEPDEDSPESWDWRTLLDTSFVSLVSVQPAGGDMPTLTREQQDVLHDENDEFEREVDREVSRILDATIDEVLMIADELQEKYDRKASVMSAVARRLIKIAEDNGGDNDPYDR